MEAFLGPPHTNIQTYKYDYEEKTDFVSAILAGWLCTGVTTTTHMAFNLRLF